MLDKCTQECARADAWLVSGWSGHIDHSGEIPTGMPPGWPTGVDATQYTAAFAAKYGPPPEAITTNEAPSPSVAAFRKLIIGDA